MDLSECKHVSPILDGFATGQRISDHDGVCCYPAIAEQTADKYIVKIISIPATPVQTEALLLTGAFADKAAVLDYYRELADGVVQETDILARLSRLEGFVGFEQVQVVPMEDDMGFQIYLLSPYRRSIETIFSKEVLTHRQIMDMGLDLCNALAACRRAGYLYIDLKPSNVFQDTFSGYRIGDLGFVALDGLKYASLPSKYRSSYTAPEIADPLAVLNPTADIYALGLLLYAAYNGGQLPLDPDGSVDVSAPPMYADYEMAEILMKACAEDPEQRWQDPTQMGQALVGYMQRNSVCDDPIIPPPVEIPEPEEDIPEEFLPEEDADDEFDALEQELLQDDGDASPEEVAPEDTAEMLAQAEELMTLVPPDPVVAPEPIDVPMPEPIPLEEPKVPDSEPAVDVTVAEQAEEVSPDAENVEAIEATPAPVENVEAEATTTVTPPAPKEKKHRSTKWLLFPILLLLVAAIVLGSWFFYTRYYLQNVDDLTVEGTDASLIVKVSSQIDETLLNVICTDIYGNRSTASVSAGIAVFDRLNPQTRYSIELEISGFHQLTGKTTTSYTTATQTNILSFDAITGPVDGSVILTLSANGPVPESWNIRYQAHGEEAVSKTFSGNTVTIAGLTVGKEYTFTLEEADDVYLAGTTEIKHTASNVIYAQNIAITECHGGKLTVCWAAPEGVTVESWTVHCSDASGYNETVTVSGLEYTFTGMDHLTPCTVEITANGMSQSASVSITANPVTISGFTHSLTDAGTLQLQWNFTDLVPENGWKLHWYIDGTEMPIIECTENMAEISLLIPGSVYTFTLEAADGTYIFNDSYRVALPEAETFSGYKVTSEDMTLQMFRVPEKEKWTLKDVAAGDYISDFTDSDMAGIAIGINVNRSKSKDVIQIMCVVHDAEGAYVSCESIEMVWNDMWDGKNCALTMPTLPQTAGEYIATVYFNGAYAGEHCFTVAQQAAEDAA